MKFEDRIIGGLCYNLDQREADWLRQYAGNWEILLMLEGTIQISHHDKHLQLNAAKHNVLIYKPGVAYRFHGCKGAKYIFIHLKLRKEIEDIVKISGPIEGLECFSLAPEMYCRIKNDLLEITELVKKHLPKYDLLALTMAETVILRVTESSVQLAEKSFQLSSAFAMLTQYQNFSMEEIAHACGLSVSAFYKIFKQETGESPRIYRERFKIHEAIRLLCETELSLSDIASKINMYDQYYLCKRFKKFCGVSPSVYRKTHK